MKILFVTAEAGPFVSVGGLSQVSYFLPNALLHAGEDVKIFTPKFGAMEEMTKGKKPWPLEMETEGLRVPVAGKPGDDDLICNVKTFSPQGRVQTYFLENREYYELRANVFGYKDDHVRFALLCTGCLEWLLLQRAKGGWWPDVIHCNDWHTSYLIELARSSPRYKELLTKVKIVLTVHNFGFQGNFDYKYCSEEDRDDGSKPLLGILEQNLHKQNALLRGILYADAINTVSPTHAKEVLTEEYGEGLQQVLRKKQDKLSGILNGLDAISFDPAKDKLLKAKFGVQNFEEARAINKAELQKLFGLPMEQESFLVAFSGRLTEQKGISLLVKAAPHLLGEYQGLQMVFLGGGEDAYRKQLTQLQADHPKQVGLHLISNFKLPRKIFGGADAILLPSIFEPGGIVALEALRYGAVPIVRRTGGLSDIVTDFDPMTKKGNGFSFDSIDPWALYGTIVEARTTFLNKALWKQLTKNCLQSDFSWDMSARQYQKWYRKVKIER